jgi:hypothetical protein
VGAPHDRLLIDDLPKARDYALYIVQDCLYLTDAERRMLKETICGRGKTVLWVYAPGIVGDAGVSPAAVSDLVGMRLAVYDVRDRLHLKFTDSTHPYTEGLAGTEYPTYDEFGPLLYVDDPQATTVGMGWCCYGVNKPAFAVRKMPDWTSVYCAVPALPPAVVRNIAREAGVHIYCENGDFVAANRWLVCVCAASDGTHTIRLPRRATVTDAMTHKMTAWMSREFDVKMRYGETRLWTLEP